MMLHKQKIICIDSGDSGPAGIVTKFGGRLIFHLVKLDFDTGPLYKTGPQDYVIMQDSFDIVLL